MRLLSVGESCHTCLTGFLNRFGEQFPALFAKLVTTWYKAAVELITSKVHKVIFENSKFFSLI